jgi:hypothetical protein
MYDIIENGFKVHVPGTLEESLEWIFSEFLADREPEFDIDNWL